MAAPQFEVLTNSRFYLELKLDGSQDLIDAYFMECQGFKRSQDVIEIAEVTPLSWGSNNQAKSGRVIRSKIPGNTKSDNIVLKRGLTLSMTMWKWFQAVEEGKWARLDPASASMQTEGNHREQVYNADLVLYNQGAEEKARFRLIGAWPCRYKIGDLKAGNKDFEMEELELVVDHFYRIK